MPLDFLMPSERVTRSGTEIFPIFLVGKSKDLMVRGKDFYAIWDDAAQRWTKDWDDAIRLIDAELYQYAEDGKERGRYESCRVLYLRRSDTGSIDKWIHYLQHQSRDFYHQLDDKIIFAGQETSRTDYSTFCLPYALQQEATPAYDELISTLYSPEERQKIEWAIGAVVSGDSRWIQKFCVFVGDAGTGKSTILMIIRWLFGDYCATIDAKAIGSASAAFALESLRSNPLVAIQDDTDLSKIEDNTRLNSLISHEPMNVNEKFKSTYEATFHCMLFLGSNKEVQITDSKSGLIRRLIDIEPTGNKLSFGQYQSCMDRIKFELGGIAWHCLEIYKANPDIYHNYVPTKMMRSTNVVYSFLEENTSDLIKDDGISLATAWAKYKEYCDEGDIMFRLNKQKFKVELKGYFQEFYPETRLDDGTHVWNWFSGFKWEKLGMLPPSGCGDTTLSDEDDSLEELDTWIVLKKQPSLLDEEFRDCPAQYATRSEKPRNKWSEVTTTLKDLDTSKTHYLKVPNEHYIVVDFDLKNERGEKDASLNLEAASSFPPTYVECSKSGAGLHLHYIYSGDVSLLSRLYSDDIEVKVYTGDSSLRRKLVKCNDIPIATINSGLPTKTEVRKIYNEKMTWTNKKLHSTIYRALNKEIHDYTKGNIDWIDHVLNEAYDAGVVYDVSDMYTAMYAFACKASNSKDYCLKVLDNMKLKSEGVEEKSLNEEYTADSDELIFFDVEVFPNLFVVVWKAEGKEPIIWINPTAHQIEYLSHFKLIGFNNRNYDNHICWARIMGYSNYELYLLSQRLIAGDKNAKFPMAFNFSYTDIYDYASAMHKQSLKKWEIALGIPHKECGLKWDEEVPPDKWNEVAQYCANDVMATEAVHKHLSGDWTARQILADLAGGSVNDTTNQLTAKLIFEGKKKSETDKELVYTDLRTLYPGYEYSYGKSTYRGEEVGEGGYVYAEPGMYTDIALLDIASMHPTSIEQLNLFGKYTKNYSALKKGRILIKHKDWDELGNLLNGKLKPYVDKALASGDMHILKDLSNALKTALNSAYGLTSAKFENQLRHKDNVDNIVAKRGSLFMVNLKHEVQARGFTVAHIKTDSIKIPNATPEIIQFVMDYGKEYGYDFEHEATYDRMCLVNDAVYIAKYADGDHETELSTGEKIMTPWTATGAQFAVPYIFKTLFSHTPIKFKDLQEVKSVKTSLYLDMNEGLPDVTAYEKEYKKLEKDICNASGAKKAELIARKDELDILIYEGHDYHFVGRVGAFCPIKPGRGGGLLMREKDGKYSFATGAKGYRWLEASDVEGTFEDDIDISYFKALVDDAVTNISQYGDFEWFVEEAS